MSEPRRAFVPTWDDVHTLFRLKSGALGLMAYGKPTPLHDAVIDLIIRMAAELELRDPQPDHPGSVELEFYFRATAAEAERTGTIAKWKR